MTVCRICSMEAIIGEFTYLGDDESPEEHMKRVHPGGVSRKYARELEEKVADKIAERTF